MLAIGDWPFGPSKEVVVVRREGERGREEGEDREGMSWETPIYFNF